MKTKMTFSKMQLPTWLWVICIMLLSLIGLRANATSPITATCNASGYVNALGVGGTGNMIGIGSPVAPSGNNRGWASFDIPNTSLLPSDAIITSVFIEFTVANISGLTSVAWNDLYAFTGATTLDPSLYTKCGGGATPSVMHISKSAWLPSGSQSIELFCAASDFIKNNQGGTLNVGFVREAASTTIYDIYGDGSGINEPKLIINYIQLPPCPPPNFVTSQTTTASACYSYTWGVNGQTYTSSGTYCHHNINAGGCNNTEILILTLNPPGVSPPSTTTTAIDCDDYTWICNNQTYTASGMYTCTYLGSSGCVETDNLDLTILYSTTSSMSVTASNSYTWSCNGAMYNASGIYTCVTTNYVGCDSTVTLDLTITNTNNSYTNPIVVGQAPCPANAFVNTQDNTSGSIFTDSYTGAFNQASNDVWYKFTLANDATVDISTCASALFDTYLHLLNNSGGHIASNDDYLAPNSVLCGSGADYYKASLSYALTAGDYYLVVEGYGNDEGSITTSISVSFLDCYCVSKATNPSDEEIYKVTFNAGTIFEGSTNPAYVNGCSLIAPGAGSVLNCYSNFNHSSIGALTTLLPGHSIPFKIEENECDGPTYWPFGTAIWIDYNRDSDFDDLNEKVFVENVTAIGPRNIIGSFTVPTYVTCGPTMMRIMVAENYAGAALTPCLQYGYGETEDHVINIGSPDFSQTAAALCSYTWACNNITYTASGLYTCTTIDANGCVQTTHLNLTVGYPAPVVTNVTHCGNSYTWNGNTYTASGTYTYTVAPCFMHVLNLTLHPEPSINVIVYQPTTCAGAFGLCSGGMTIYPIGGTPNYTVSINPGVTNPNVTSTGFSVGNLCSGTYIITVTDAFGCTASTTVVLNEPPHPTLNVITHPGCPLGGFSIGMSGGLPNYDVTVSGPTNESFSNMVGPFSTYSTYPPGTYTITVCDSNGCCADTIIILVSLPICAVANSLSINTGTNSTGGLLAVGQNDSKWTILNIGNIPGATNGSAIVTYEAAWNNTSTVSKAISFAHPSSFATPNTTPGFYNITFRREFKTCADDSLHFDFQMIFDNWLNGIYIDGILITNPNTVTGSINNSIYWTTYQPYIFTRYLSAGVHTLDINVVNFATSSGGNPTGLNLKGTISSNLNSLVANTSPLNCCCQSCNSDFTLLSTYCKNKTIYLASNTTGSGITNTWEITKANSSCNSVSGPISGVIYPVNGDNVSINLNSASLIAGQRYRIRHIVYNGTYAWCETSKCFSIPGPIKTYINRCNNIPYTWPVNGNTYTLTGIYTHTILTLDSCLVTYQLNLTYNNQSALRFDGVNDNVSIPNSTELNFGTNNFTIEAWTKVEAGIKLLPTIISKRSNTNNGFTIFTYNGRLRIQVGGGSYYGPYGPDLRDGICHHIAVTRTGNLFKVFVDNMNVAVGSFTRNANISSTSPMYLGWDIASPFHTNMKGTIDEVRIWNYSRTSTQLNYSSICNIAPQYGLVAYYKMNEGVPLANNSTVPQLVDNSNHGHYGSFNNMPRTGTNSNYVVGCVPCCPIYYPYDVVTACDNYTWATNGVTYTTSGIYSASNDTLDLTILPSTASTTSVAFTNSFTWSGNGSTYTSSGVYTTTIVNANGCESTTTLNLTINPGAFTLNVVEDQPISCAGNNDGAVYASVPLGGSYSYTMNNPTQPSVTNTTGFFTNMEPGMHTVCATSNTAPFASVCSQIILNEPDPLSVLVISDSIPSCAGNTGAISAIIAGGTSSLLPYLTYWYDVNNNLLNPTGYFDQTLTGLSAGIYTLVVEDDHGCTGTTSIDLPFDSCLLNLGTYPSTSLIAGTNTTIAPNASITNVLHATASTHTNFTGVLAVDPSTGLVTVTDAKPAGVYTVTIHAFNTTDTVSTSFVLTVTDPLCSQGLFTIASNVVTSGVMNNIAIGDFNKDGKQDLAISAYQGGNGKIFIRLGDGNGGFNPDTTADVTAGTELGIGSIADMNGDGNQDLVGRTYNFIHIFFGDGNGNFPTSTSVPTGLYPFGDDVGDVNHDGKTDLGIADYGNNIVSIRLGDGMGGFTGSTNIPVGNGPHSVEFTDFNNDGNLDFVSANYDAGNFSIRFGDSLGNFSIPPYPYPSELDVESNGKPVNTVTGDINKDGIQDIIVANYDNYIASVFLGDATSGFVQKPGLPLGYQSSPEVELGDFNGDGHLDVVVSNANPTIYLGNGQGYFNYVGASPPVGGASSRSRVGDFNNDGIHDLALNEYYGNNYIVLGGRNEINVTGNNVSISDGDITPSIADNTDYGAVPIGNSLGHTFTIQNTSDVTLKVSAINITGIDASEFSVSGITLPVTIAPNGVVNFNVVFSPTAPGSKSAMVEILNDNCDKENYDFAVQGGILAVQNTLNIKCYLEGLYIGSGMMTPALMNQGVGTNATISDSITVELRNSTAPYAFVDSSNAILNTNGTATCNFSVAGDYYIVLKHRNALQTWSANPVTIGTLPVTYNFSDSANKAYGSNQIEIETSVWAIYSGDIVIDENIDLLDLGDLEADINNFIFGYYATDINGDGNVDLLDAPTVEANINNFIFSAHP